MQMAEKQGAIDHQRSHSFPTIEKSEANAANQSSEACHSFRPLYQCNDQTSGKSASDSRDHSATDGGRDTLEQIKEKRFLEGLEAGKADACQIVQKDLEIPVQRFLSEKDRYSNCVSQITNSYPDHVVALALAIAKKILGKPSLLKSEHLEPISGQLNATLQGQYRLSVKINTDDIESLTELMACSRPQWKQSDALEFTGDEKTRKGQVLLDRSDASLGIIKDAFKQKVEDILSHHPTP